MIQSLQRGVAKVPSAAPSWRFRRSPGLGVPVSLAMACTLEFLFEVENDQSGKVLMLIQQ